MKLVRVREFITSFGLRISSSWIAKTRMASGVSKFDLG